MQSTQGAEVGNRGRNWRLAALAGSIALLAVLIVGGSAPLRPNDAVAASGVPEMALTITQGGFCVANDCYAAAGKDFMLVVYRVQIAATCYIPIQTSRTFGCSHINNAVRGVIGSIEPDSRTRKAAYVEFDVRHGSGRLLCGCEIGYQRSHCRIATLTISSILPA